MSRGPRLVDGILPLIGAIAVWYGSKHVASVLAVVAVLSAPALLRVRPANVWFMRKVYGWGWRPATWQGWLTTLLYLGFLLVIALVIDEDRTPRHVLLTRIVPAALLTIAFIRLVVRTGEQPRWQWGRKGA